MKRKRVRRARRAPGGFVEVYEDRGPGAGVPRATGPAWKRDLRPFERQGGGKVGRVGPPTTYGGSR